MTTNPQLWLSQPQYVVETNSDKTPKKKVLTKSNEGVEYGARHRFSEMLIESKISRGKLSALLHAKWPDRYGKTYYNAISFMVRGVQDLSDRFLADVESLTGISADWVKWGLGQPRVPIAQNVRTQNPKTPAERLSKLMEEEKKTPTELARTLMRHNPTHYKDSYRTTLSNLLSGRSKIPELLLKNLQEALGWNPVWIKTGEGKCRVPATTETTLDLPMLTIEEQQSKLFTRNVTKVQSWITRHRLYGPLVSDQAGKWVIEVAGALMAPQFQPEAKLLCQPIAEKSSWKLAAGVHVVCFSDSHEKVHVLIRRIDPQKATPDTIRLQTDSKPPVAFSLPIRQIHWLAKVERILDSPVV